MRVAALTAELKAIIPPREDFGPIVRELMRHMTLVAIAEACGQGVNEIRTYRDTALQPRDRTAQTLRVLHRHFCGEKT